jgi:thiamine-monophosphate kinase
MGGKPRFALVSLALSRNAPSRWFGEFYQGLQSLARRFNVKLIGGDTALSPGGTVVDAVLVGEVRSGFAVRRSGARPGDRIFVSGRVGLSAWGLKLIRSKSRSTQKNQRAAIRSHLYPTPRCTLGERLALNRAASAMIDVSDGLALDLHRLCEASGVGARLRADSIPHPDPTGNLLQRHAALRLALEGGEDYELLFTVSPKKARQLSAKPAGVALTEIGEITRGRKIEIVQDGKTRRLASGGYDHFRRKRN